jgi:arsenite methyltransferase
MTIKAEPPTEKEIREAVRAWYAGIALKSDAYSADSCGSQSDCCNGTETEARAEKLGYSQDELSIAPDGSNLGLGCGNPVAFANLTRWMLSRRDAPLGTGGVSCSGRIFGDQD